MWEVCLVVLFVNTRFTSACISIYMSAFMCIQTMQDIKHGVCKMTEHDNDE